MGKNGEGFCLKDVEEVWEKHFCGWTVQAVF
jgi:hypothetical protein